MSDVADTSLSCSASPLLSSQYVLSRTADVCSSRSAMNEQDPLDRGALSRKANLWGLKLSERQRILQHVFRATTRAYHEDRATSNRRRRG